MLSMSEPSSRENFYPLKLPTELYQALIDRMSKTHLSKGDCIIDMMTETAYREGYLSQEFYDFLKKKYGTKTVMEKVLENRMKREGQAVIPKPEPDQKTVQLKKTLIMIAEQWDIHDEQWKQKTVEWIEKKGLKDTPEVKQILKKAEILNGGMGHEVKAKSESEVEG